MHILGRAKFQSLSLLTTRNWQGVAWIFFLLLFQVIPNGCVTYHSAIVGYTLLLIVPLAQRLVWGYLLHVGRDEGGVLFFGVY